MKKFLAILTVLFLMQLLLPAAGNFSLVKLGLTSAGQAKATSVSQVKVNVEFADAAKEICAKNVDIPFENADLSVQDATKKIKSNDVTNAFKQSIESNAISQSGGPFWAKTFGGSSDDESYSVQQTSDGGYIVYGSTKSFGAGSVDLLIIKLDSKGNIDWAKTYGGANEEGSWYEIEKAPDGGYIVPGWTKSFGSRDKDLFIIKLDSKGNIDWAKIYGGPKDELPWDVTSTIDGGYIVSGLTNSFGAGSIDFLIIKLDSSGNLTWAKTFGGRKLEVGSFVYQTSDGGYIVSGRTNSFGAGGSDIFVFKLNSSGNIQWAKTYGGTNNDGGINILKASDGGYIVVGWTYSFGAGSADAFIIKLNSDGQISWAKTYGGSDWDAAYYIQQTSDGGYIVTGATTSFGARDSGCLIIKIDSKGNLSWAKVFDRSNDDWGNDIRQTSDGGYIVAGVTKSFGAGKGDYLVLKLDSNGNIPGVSCKFLKDVTKNLTVKSVTPTVSSVKPITMAPHLSVSSPKISVSSPHLSTSTICESPEPFPPQNLTALVDTANKAILLKWDASAQGKYPIKGYAIYRGEEKGKEDFSHPIGAVDANTTQYTDKTVEVGRTYYYVVKAFDNQIPPNYSEPSNEVSIEIKDTTPPTITINSPEDNSIVNTDTIHIKGTVKDDVSVSKLTVQDKEVSFDKDGQFDAEVTLKEGKNTITITATDKAGNKATKTITVTYKPKTVITLQPDNPMMTVNGVQQEIDPGRGTKPVIIPKWGRTVVPIRAIVEALGGTIEWDGTERKVTINFNGTVIELWIDKPQARVNGTTKWIDPNNHDVKPIIVNDRTMLPLRFVAENLGCKVDWNGTTRTITIIYTP